jgi:cellulose synthase operon protein C
MRKLSYLVLSTVLFPNLVLGAPSTGWNKPKEPTVRRISIKKRAQWVHGQWNPTPELEENRTNVLSTRRRAYITQIERILNKASLKSPKNVDNYVELCLRLVRYCLEENHALISGSTKPAKDVSPEFYLKKVESILGQLLKRFPLHSRADEFLYLRGVLSMDSKRVPEAIKDFQNLVVRYPTSRFVFDASTQIGDYEFEAGRFKQAEARFDYILRAKHTPLLSYATFKKAWCAHNTDRHREAVQLFNWIIENEPTLPSARLLKMRDEAIMDAVYPLVALADGDAAIAFYRSLEKVSFYKGLEAAAMLFFERGVFLTAEKLWEQLLLIDPTYAKSPFYDRMIIEARFRRNKRDSGVERLAERLPIYLEKGEWKKYIQTEAPLWEEMTRKQASFFHSVGLNTKDQKAIALAKKAYGLHLAHFPEAPESHQVTFQFAGLFSSLKEHRPASQYFYQAFLKAQSPERAERSLESALGSQLSLLGREMERGERGKKGPQAATEITEDEEKFLDLTKQFMKGFAKSDKIPYVRWERAAIYYSHGVYDKAVPEYEEILKTHPKHRLVYPTARVLLDIANHQKDWEALVARCEFLMKSPLQEPKFQTEVKDIYRHALLKKIQGLETKKEFAKAGEEYRDFCRKHGHADAKLHEVALYNSAVNFDLALRHTEAQDQRKAFLKLFPKSKQHGEVLLSVANRYRDMGEFTEGAKHYEEFAKLPEGKSKQGALAMEWASSLHWAAGNANVAEKTLNLFAERFPKEKKRINELRLSLYEGEQWATKAFRLHEELSQNYNPAKAFFHLAKAAEWRYKSRGRIPMSVLRKLAEYGSSHKSAIKRSPEALDLYSRTMIQVLMPQEAEFRSIRITSGEQVSEKRIERKLELIQALEKDFSKIASLGSSEWGLAAIYKTAVLYRRLGDEISQAPLPASLKGPQLEEYRATVKKKIVDPLSGKAKAFANRCLTEAGRHGILSRWIIPCYEIAHSLSPEEMPALRTFYTAYLEPSIIDDKGNSIGYTSELGALSGVYYQEIGGAAQLLEGELADVLSAGKLGTYPYAIETQRNKLRAKNGENRSLAREDLTSDELMKLALSVPEKSIRPIKFGLQKNPNSLFLTNLLGVALLKSGQYVAAEIVFENARLKQPESSAIQNNLSLIKSLKGETTRAIAGFEKANKAGSKEAAFNLGALALRVRNGKAAQAYFAVISDGNLEEKAADGMFTAYLQDGAFDKAQALVSNGLGITPYRQLAQVYWLLDVGQETEGAENMAQTYLQDRAKQELENEDDHFFRKALEEIKRLKGTTVAELANQEDLSYSRSDGEREESEQK